MRFEFSIKDKIWCKLPEKWQDKTLCIECFLELLEKEAPKQEINLNDFHFLGIIGDLDNKDKTVYPKLKNPKFGGILLDKTN